ncbi:hypothetical protein LX97_02390 [Nonlabens dokdonensis]|jgi:short subunit fatty acids transporter|uniref:Uncharacterized protein n=2 Tax=Nonlabens dokdonensis TaxID=328515 RepID=L7W171_NONDD|nr:hypothetical protein [Nonlabens dokdonensis]AGC75235.1 hypothetical protein DDD_0108 [Nonlabens dokdonensis DSW-6]PZX39024.1 hypothetical protein LX97_02390 [Nonlabens dokdonensis]
MRKNDIHNKAGFQIPDGYLEQLTDRVLENVEVKESNNHAGFKVPEDYFEKLEDKLMSHLEEEPKVIPLNQTDLSSSKKWSYPLLAVAAVFIGVIALNGMFTSSQSNMVTFADVEDQEIIEYLAQSNFLQDEESIEILFADNSVLSDIKIEQEITDNELLDYLMEDGSLDQILTE